MYFSENIVYLRNKYGLSRKELADRLGYNSLTTIQKWENGQSLPPAETLMLLSGIFGISINDLLGVDLSTGISVSLEDVADTNMDDFDKRMVQSYHDSSAHIRSIVRTALKLRKERPNKE